ncbi:MULTISPECIES: HAMP domain-containing sensor histidine kinase [Pseudoxanthomonas]|jgi:signal transduction histidine kinase|uniref:sensor histidine kinase n=1 Tax=Pseudoxanthomonas TaxID=83618 RepID=UPI0016207831|nr:MULTISPECIES: HAMP domain-containing sensor histidine kinase [Pseudoxanthomonas]MBB3277862.1 signal transduction histidine kinase [Pseudoxanthomonas sp. OG2]MBD9375908.1 HAMP domain-containing histidine kinase [Pseudoxanthomonas sp. PXM04]MBV7474533.1 HAMP domain-containing histidine kinase [Pseudoxanthomonas sp. PXM05]UBB25915.1 HAMP domain-containing histidine kinase [Pseudoxanthomonas japonensis]
MATAEPGRPAAARARKFRHRLRTRIILSFFLLGTGLTGLFAYLTDVARQRVETQLVEDVMNQNIDEYMRRFYLDPSGNPDIKVQQIRAYVFAPDSERLRTEFPDWIRLRDGTHNITGVDETGVEYAYKLAVRKAPEQWFFLAYDMTQSRKGEVQLKRWLYLAVLLFGALSLIIGWWSASRVMSPVSNLARRLRAYKGSSDPKPLAPHFPEDEVGELAKALDDYSDRLTEVVQRDREFNADVSHELRTPLAIIRGSVELMLSRQDLDEKTRTRILRIQRAEQQCTDLISALLLLSRSERGHGNTDVGRVAEQLLDAHRAQLGGKTLDLRVEGDCGLKIDAPEAALSVALGNLIGNAVKYTQEGEVVVRLLPTAVEVIDSGPGLSKEDAARLFERGYRGTHAGHSQGGGIGLSIVSRLCDLYGWRVGVKPGEQRGVIATLRFS